MPLPAPPEPLQTPFQKELRRRQSNKAKVLQALQGGPQLNHQLEKICRRVAARIDDLKKDGWEIVTDRLSFTDFRYTLKGKQL